MFSIHPLGPQEIREFTISILIGGVVLGGVLVCIGALTAGLIVATIQFIGGLFLILPQLSEYVSSRIQDRDEIKELDRAKFAIHNKKQAPLRKGQEGFEELSALIDFYTESDYTPIQFSLITAVASPAYEGQVLVHYEKDAFEETNFDIANLLERIRLEKSKVRSDAEYEYVVYGFVLIVIGFGIQVLREIPPAV